MRTCEAEIFDGEVACPYAEGERVDVQACYRCSHLRLFYDEGSRTRVVCARPLHIGLRRRPRRSRSAPA